MDIYLVFGFISEDGSDEGHTYIYGVFDNRVVAEEKKNKLEEALERDGSDGEIIGYLFDDKCKYISAGSCARRKVAQVIRSPEQFFHPRCHFARQSKQIAFRLKKMGEDKLARLFDDDAALLLIINMWNLEIEDDDFSFVTQDMISPILEGKTND